MSACSSELRFENDRYRSYLNGVSERRTGGYGTRTSPPSRIKAVSGQEFGVQSVRDRLLKYIVAPKRETGTYDKTENSPSTSLLSRSPRGFAVVEESSPGVSTSSARR